jgi:NAD(P)-dependent dehydrogenase (short-subunit alcohol dehydrogenase family)
MTGRLAGRKALVTGAANGIGRAIAARFLAEGADTILSDIDGTSAETAAAELNATAGTGHGKALASACDVSRGQDVTAMFQLAEREFGKLDVLVNNAGLNVRGDFRHMSDSDWVRIREVNLDGVVRIARDGFDLLKASGNGALINLASIMGHRGLRQLAGYAATKGAVSALTRGLAVEYAAFGIRVNAIAPGFIETALTERVLKNPLFNKALLDQTPMRKFGAPEDVAGAALFLASDDAAFVTGAEIAVDGGMAAGL